MAHQFGGTGRTNMEGLNKPQTRTARRATTHHAGQQSVATDFGRRPTVHVTPVSDHNAATNAKLLQAGRAVPIKQPSVGEMIGAGLITEQ
jgi:hypothetical protein